MNVLNELSSTRLATRPRYVALSAHLLALSVCLFIAAQFEVDKLIQFTDGNIWWHLRTGLWMLEHWSVPRKALFSQAANLSWSDTNWAFDALVGCAYKWFGLRGLLFFLVFLRAMQAGGTFLMARGLRANIWSAMFLTLVAQMALTGIGASPATLSILFFEIELLILVSVRHSGTMRRLYWLPLLLAVWVNVDEHFVYGLIALILFVPTILRLESERLPGLEQSRRHVLSPAQAGALIGFSALATLCSPYPFQQYRVFFSNAYGKVTFSRLPELHAMNFRHWQNYVLLLLVCSAFLKLGRKHSTHLFALGGLVISSGIAFHCQLNGWVAVIPAIAVLATIPHDKKPELKVRRERRWQVEALLFVSATAVATFAAASLQIPKTDALLLEHIGTSYPVKACDYIRSNHLAPPIYNAYQWGGFLTWYLPGYPVAIDGRLDMYGADMNDLHFKVANGMQPLDTDDAFVGAQTILLVRHSPMAEALSSMTGFQTVYRDDVAVVLAKLP